MMARNKAAHLFRLQKKYTVIPIVHVYTPTIFFSKFLKYQKKITNNLQAISIYFWSCVLKILLIYLLFIVQNRHFELQNKLFFLVTSTKAFLIFLRGFNIYSLTWLLCLNLCHALVCIKYVPILWMRIHISLFYKLLIYLFKVSFFKTIVLNFKIYFL